RASTDLWGVWVGNHPDLPGDHPSVKRLPPEGKRGREWNQCSDLKPEKRRAPLSRPRRCDRRLERCACRSDRPKRRTVALRASVGSTDASASLPARVGVVGLTRLTFRSVLRVVRSRGLQLTFESRVPLTRLLEG